MDIEINKLADKLSHLLRRLTLKTKKEGYLLYYFILTAVNNSSKSDPVLRKVSSSIKIKNFAKRYFVEY